MKKTIFERLLEGEIVRMDDPDYSNIRVEVEKSLLLSKRLNQSESIDEIRKNLSALIGNTVDSTSTLFIPFHTNYGKNISIGKNVFINHGCSFLDLGGITIEDDVMIAPYVKITSENHPIDIASRNSMIPKRVTIKKGAWIGAGAIILPGVTIGENSVVAAGATVTRDVPANVVVGGVPAKVIKEIS